jgi:hypothetical protein
MKTLCFFLFLRLAISAGTLPSYYVKKRCLSLSLSLSASLYINISTYQHIISLNIPVMPMLLMVLIIIITPIFCFPIALDSESLAITRTDEHHTSILNVEIRLEISGALPFQYLANMKTTHLSNRIFSISVTICDAPACLCRVSLEFLLQEPLTVLQLPDIQLLDGQMGPRVWHVSA